MSWLLNFENSASTMCYIEGPALENSKREEDIGSLVCNVVCWQVVWDSY